MRLRSLRVRARTTTAFAFFAGARIWGAFVCTYLLLPLLWWWVFEKVKTHTHNRKTLTTTICIWRETATTNREHWMREHHRHNNMSLKSGKSFVRLQNAHYYFNFFFFERESAALSALYIQLHIFIYTALIRNLKRLPYGGNCYIYLSVCVYNLHCAYSCLISSRCTRKKIHRINARAS